MLQKESESPQGMGHFPTLSVPPQALLEMRTWCLGMALWLQGLHFGCGPSFVIGLARAASASAWGWGCRCQLLPLHPDCRLPHQHPVPHPDSPLFHPVLCNHLHRTTFSRHYAVTTHSLAHPDTLLASPIPEPGSRRYSMSNIMLSYKPQKKKKSNKCLPMHFNNAIFLADRR